MMDPRRTRAAVPLVADVRQQRAGKGDSAAAAGFSATVDEALSALGRLERVAREQGADVRSIGLVRCAQDAVQALVDRYRLGVFKSEGSPVGATDEQDRVDESD